MSEPHPVAIVVEDEAQIRRFIRSSLEAEGWRVHEMATLNQGLIGAASRKPDLIVLDLGLPDGDGAKLIADVRTWSNVPILVLSARSTEDQKIAALDAGADDYLTKPFSVGELLARTRVALRRHRAGAAADSGVLKFGDVQIDLAARSVTRAGDVVHLTTLEYRLLALLAAHAGKVLTQKQLLQEIWGPNYSDSGHYVRVYMRRLRAKLEADSERPAFLLTEIGVGYRLLAEPA